MRSSPGSVRVWSSVPGAATAISRLPSPSRSATAATTPPKPPRRSVPFQWCSSPPLPDERTQAPPTIAPSASVAIVVSGGRQVPPEVLALGLGALPELLAGLGRTGHHHAPHAPVDRGVWRRDDQVGEPIARNIRHRHHPVTEEPVRRLTIPRA